LLNKILIIKQKRFFVGVSCQIFYSRINLAKHDQFNLHNKAVDSSHLRPLRNPHEKPAWRAAYIIASPDEVALNCKLTIYTKIEKETFICTTAIIKRLYRRLYAT